MPSSRGRLSRKTWDTRGGVMSLGHLPSVLLPCPRFLPTNSMWHRCNARAVLSHALCGAQCYPCTHQRTHPSPHPTHPFDPVRHDVGAGGAEVEVEDHDGDDHHGRHQKHDKKQIPGREHGLGADIATGARRRQSCPLAPRDSTMSPLHPAVPRTHLPMRGMAWEVAGRRWEISRRKTDWARSTEITKVIFSPPEEHVSSGQTLPQVALPEPPVPGLPFQCPMIQCPI